MGKDLKRLARDLARQGFRVRTSRRGHLIVQQDGVTVAVLAGTPSDWRATRNGVARLRRAGYVPAGR